MIILLALLVALPVVLAERRHHRAAPPKPRRRYTAAVLYTRTGEPRWGLVGAWDRGHHQRLSRRRLKGLARG